MRQKTTLELLTLQKDGTRSERRAAMLEQARRFEAKQQESGARPARRKETRMNDPFAMTTDVNGKPIPRWQDRLEAMYTANIPFGEILGFVRYLLEERDINAILNAPDDVILASFSGDIEAYAAEMRQRFDVIARLVAECDQWKRRARELEYLCEDRL